MLSRTLYQCLISCDSARLDAIAERWGIESTPSRRHDLAAVLSEEMLIPYRLNATWTTLTDEEKAAVAAIQAAEEPLPWPTFTRRWGTVRSMGPGRITRERPWESPVSPAEGLWYWGLVYRIPTEGPTGLYETAFIPDELQTLLPALSAPGPARMAPAEVDPAITRPATAHLLDDACTLLAYVQNHRVRPAAEGAWPSPHEGLLRTRLRDRDLVRLAFLRHLAGQLGWLRRDDGNRLRPDPDNTVNWLQATPTQQRSALADAWRDSVEWNELWQVPTLHPDDTGSWHNDPTLAREAVIHALGGCETGEWYEIATLVATIKADNPDFQRPDGDYASWYIRDATTGEHLSGFESWDAVEGALIRYLITRPLAWLGIVDLGARLEEGEATAFRLSPGGGAFLERSDAEEEPVPSPLTLRLDLSIEIDAARRYDRFQLSRIAEWVSSGDRYTYRLCAGSMDRAREQGISLQRVSDFLEEATERALPPTVKNALGRWARAGTEVEVERAILLRTKDIATLEEITTSPGTRHLIEERLGPTAALVSSKKWPRLIQALVKAGWLPGIKGLE